MTAVTEPTSIVRALRAAHLHDRTPRELLELACTRIRALGSPFTSVYAYRLRGHELVLEAFAGRETEHTRIPVGTGVCGTAVATDWPGFRQMIDASSLAAGTWQFSQFTSIPAL